MNIRYTAPKTNSFSKWFNIISFEINGSTAYGVVSLSGGDNFDANRAGGMLIEQIQNSLIESGNDKDNLSLLKKALKEAKQGLLRITENSTDIDVNLIDVYIVITLIDSDVAYFAKFDGGGVYIMRDGEIIDITSHLHDPSGINQIFLGSGLINEGDKILLSTKHFEEGTADAEFKNAEFEQEVNDYVLLMLGIGEETALPADEIEEEVVPVTNQSPELESVDENAEMSSGESLEASPDLTNTEPLDPESDEKVTQKLLAMMLVLKLKVTGLVSSFKNRKSASHSETTQVSEDQSVMESGDSFTSVEPNNDENTLVHIIKNVVSKLTSLIQNLLVKIKRLFSKNNSRLKIKGAKGKFNYKLIIVGVLIVGGLIFIGSRSLKKGSEQRKTNDELASYYSQSDEAIANANEVKDLNKTRAKSYIEEALALLDKAGSLEEDPSSVESKKSEVLGILDEINGVTTISDYDILFDSITSYESDGLVDFAMQGSDFYVLDSKKGALYKVTSNKSEEQILADGTFSKPYRIESLSDNKLVVYDQEEGLIEVDPVKKEARKLAGMSTTTVGNIDELELYKLDTQDLLYSLRTDASRVDKIQKISGGFATPQLRLEDPSLANAVDMSIDGNIYILLNTAPGIIRYLGNNREDINIVGDDLNYNGFTSFDASVYLSKFYILDKVGNKIIVVSKPDDTNTNNLPILNQYVYRGDKSLLTDMKEIHVSQDEANIYVLDGSRILRIGNK